MASTISNPTIPCIEPLSEQLKPGSLIKIIGFIGDSPTCFAVNLQNGYCTEPRSDIALHLSPVFSPPPRLVRNSLENQNWGPEESHGTYFPFSTGQNFEILILADSDHFKIAVNGQHFTEFHYRLSLQNISHIAIDGDVIINEIKFEGVPKSPMDSASEEKMIKPLGFIVEKNTQASHVAPLTSGSTSLPYPSNPSFGPSTTSYIPSPTDNPYGPPPSNPYNSQHMQNPYGPPHSNMYPSGRISPSPYGPAPESSNPYGPPPGGYPYTPQQCYPQSNNSQVYPQQTNYPQGYPHQTGYPQGYPGSYPSQPGPYPGTSVVYPVSANIFPNPYQPNLYPGTLNAYPGQEKKSGGLDLSGIATAGAAALAGAAGASMLSGKKHKKHKHGRGIPGMPGAGPASLISGVGSLLSGGKHGYTGNSGHMGGMGPVGGALAGGAAALAGGYMLSKTPIGKMMKPKKMKKMYKGGWGSSSSSSSSSDEE